MRTEILHDPTIKRRWDRRRTRLRPVKLLDAHRRFLEDAMAVDISEGGLRVRREATARLPLQLSIYDQSDRTFRPAAVAWAHGALVGMRFMGPPVKATPPEIEQLTRRADTKSIYLHK